MCCHKYECFNAFGNLNAHLLKVNCRSCLRINVTDWQQHQERNFMPPIYSSVIFCDILIPENIVKLWSVYSKYSCRGTGVYTSNIAINIWYLHPTSHFTEVPGKVQVILLFQTYLYISADRRIVACCIAEVASVVRRQMLYLY